MHHEEFIPPEELHDAIKCLWYNSRDVDELQPQFEVQPDGYTEIIFYFGSLSGIMVDGSLQSLPSPFIMGLQNKPAYFSTKDRLQVIAIRCYPWTVFDLLGLSSGNDSLRTFDHPIAHLQPALQKCIDTGNIDDAVALLTKYLLNARSRVAIDSMLSKAGVAMRQANGTMPVNKVASMAHATVRTLERKFKQSSGHTVKDVSALIRFEQVRNRLWHHPDSNLAGLAQEFGYTDQSHLSREFKRYSSVTPAVFARRAKSDLLAITRSQ